MQWQWDGTGLPWLTGQPLRCTGDGQAGGAADEQPCAVQERFRQPPINCRIGRGGGRRGAAGPTCSKKHMMAPSARCGVDSHCDSVVSCGQPEGGGKHANVMRCPSCPYSMLPYT